MFLGTACSQPQRDAPNTCLGIQTGVLILQEKHAAGWGRLCACDGSRRRPESCRRWDFKGSRETAQNCLQLSLRRDPCHLGASITEDHILYARPEGLISRRHLLSLKGEVHGPQTVPSGNRAPPPRPGKQHRAPGRKMVPLTVKEAPPKCWGGEETEGLG